MNSLSTTVVPSLTPETPLTPNSVDILWRNRSSTSPAFGRNLIWELSGPDYGGSYRDLLNIPDANWSVAAVADFNRDGASDYLWRNSVTGTNVLWIMDKNGTSIAKASLIEPVPYTEWTIVAAADANGDKMVDILWRNTKTGTNLWWYMQNDKILKIQEIQPLSAPYLDWEIKGVGDANQDGKIDIFWSNRSTGAMAWWLMDKTGTKMASVVGIAADPNGGRAQAIADFNNDGQLDIVVRNQTTGENSLWIMDFTTVLDRYALTPLDSTWELDALVPRVNLETIGSKTTQKLGIPPESLTAIPKASPRFFDRNQLTGKADPTGSEIAYSFTVKESGIFTANLTGLSNDADVQLIQDANGNGLVDAGEAVLALEWERGVTRESIRKFLQAGSYFVQVKNYSPETTQYSLSSNFTAALSDDQAFKIQLNFKTGTETLTSAAKAAIVSAAAFWENAIVTRTGITQLKNLSIDILGLAITDTTILAYAAPLVTANGSSLVIASAEATLNLNRYTTLNSDPVYLRGIMIHEFAHALGFGTLWTPVDFGGSFGKIGRTWIDATTATYVANSYAGYAYGSLLGTAGAVAVPLDRIDLSHWDETRFDAELMTPYAEVTGIPMPASVLTLSALRDLGWRINLAAAQPYALPAIAA
jgi:FG-GAP-like repeat/Bacterial pre-peptidase C-terminal domain